MSLEEIVNTYGMVDYYEQSTGKIYHLSQSAKMGSKIAVPVSMNGIIVDYVTLEESKIGKNK